MYRFLLTNRATLTKPNSPLAEFRRCTVRVIFRPTYVYGSILRTANHPTYMRNGVARSIHVDVLSQEWLSTEKRPIFWQILAQEHQSLKQLDVPYFTIPAASVDLTLPDGCVLKAVFERSCYDSLMCRITELSNEDMIHQTQIIRKTLHACYLAQS